MFDLTICKKITAKIIREKLFFFKLTNSIFYSNPYTLLGEINQWGAWHITNIYYMYNAVIQKQVKKQVEYIINRSFCMSELKCLWREPEKHKLSNWISLCYKCPAVCISLLLSDTKNWLGIFSNTPHTLLEVLVNTQSQQRRDVDARVGPFRLVIALIWSSFCEACTHYLRSQWMIL